MTRLARTAGAVLAALLVVALPAAATTVLDLKVPEMAQRSKLVVRGKVSGQKVEWDTNGKPVTRTFVKVASHLKGKGPAEIVVRQPGGEIDGMKMAVSGTAKFEIGEDVVLFLEPSEPVPGEYVLLTMGGGKFHVAKSAQGTLVERWTQGLTFATRGVDGVIAPRGTGPSTPDRLTLDELVRQVQAAPAPATK